MHLNLLIKVVISLDPELQFRRNILAAAWKYFLIKI